MSLQKVTWEGLKSSMLAKGLRNRLQWFIEDKKYIVLLFDDPMNLCAHINITIPKNFDQDDFERKYKMFGNKVLDPVDSNNSKLSRLKMTQTSWTFQTHSVEFTTALKDSVYNKNERDEDLKTTTLSFFDSRWDRIPDDSSQLFLDTNVRFTVLDWEFPSDIEIFGGLLRQVSPPASDVRLWVIGAPDIPSGSGGNKFFTDGGLNLKFFNEGSSVDLDGKTPKLLKHDADLHSNKIRLILRTSTIGLKHSISVCFKIFKP